MFIAIVVATGLLAALPSQKLQTSEVANRRMHMIAWLDACVVQPVTLANVWWMSAIAVMKW